MTSAIRFSRSQSQDSHATTASSHSGASRASLHPRSNDAVQDLPSSIPSASSHPPSQLTKTTTTTTAATTVGRSSQSGSGSRSQSRISTSPSASDAAAAAAAATAAYPLNYHFPAPLPPAAGADTPAMAAASGADTYHATRTEGRPPVPAGAGLVPPVHRYAHRGGGAFPFAVPDIPWVPPPPIDGVAASDPTKMNAYLAHYYVGLMAMASAAAQQSCQQQPIPARSSTAANSGRKGKGPFSSAAAARRPCALPQGCCRPLGHSVAAHGGVHCMDAPPFRQAVGVDDWPTPDQLPLPSTFPMPPRIPPLALHHHGSDSGSECFPPPPLPPWWFLQALGIPSFAPFESFCGASSRSSSSCSSSSSRTSSASHSPSPHKGARVGQTSPYHQRHEQQKKFTAPAGSVQTPTPMARKRGGPTASISTSDNNNVSSRAGRVSTSDSASSAVPAAQPVRLPSNRALLSSTARSDAAHDVRRLPHGAPHDEKIETGRRCPELPGSGIKSREVARSMAREAEEEGEDHRAHRVLATAESYLSRIEDLYQRMRRRYEEVLLSPMKAVEQAAERTPVSRSPITPVYHAEEDVQDRIDRATRQPEHIYAAAPTRAASQTPLPPSSSSISGKATAAVRTGPSLSDLQRPSTFVSQSLRHELAMLESQWQRLEELKQHGVGAGTAVHPPADSFSRSFASTAAHLPATVAGSSPQSSLPAHGGGNVFSNQSVMELINDRKHLLASTA
jgi:hypothetical protein